MNARDYYEHDAAKTHMVPAHARVRQRRIVELVGSSQKVLDVGAGEGKIALSVMQAGNTVVGVDIAQGNVEKLAKRGIEAYRVDAEKEKLPFKNGTFDVVVAGEIIEHLFDPFTFLAECARVMKKGGRIIVTTPNLASLGRRFLLLVGKNPYIDPWAEPGGIGGHVRYYVPETLRELLRRAGFTVEQVEADIVKFDVSGKRYSTMLAKLFPSLGWELIAVGRK